MKFSVKGRQYELQSTGHIEQLDAKPYVYDAKYSATYNTEEYLRASDKLMALRTGFMIACHGSTPTNLLDMGYGAGQFMRFVKDIVPYVSGFDITGVPIPEGCHNGHSYNNEERPFINWMKGETNVVTFWDCFEHIEKNLLEDYLKGFRDCGYTVVISLPNCDVQEKGLGWFQNQYPHLKPDEHLRHFSARSLRAYMLLNGFKSVAESYFEDLVRKRYPNNILSMGFRPDGSSIY